MTTPTLIRSLKVCGPIATLAGLLFAGSAQAALIPGFGLESFPNFAATDLVVAYDHDSDTLFAVGINNVDFLPGDESGINGIDGTGFKLKMNNPVNSALSPTGPSGTIEITGTLPDFGFNSGTLLTGDIIQFGFVEEGEKAASPFELEVVFTITGGDAAALFGTTGAIGFTQTDFPGDWLDDWVNSGDGLSTTAEYSPVPIPGALLLLASGLVGVTRFRSRNAAKT